MTRHGKVPPVQPCELCGGRVLPLWDGQEWTALELCGSCNGAFQGLADRLAARAVPAAADAVHVAGQLELDALIAGLHADRDAGYYR